MNTITHFVLNGEKYLISENLTLADLIHYFGYNSSLLVVEYNHLICSQKQWAKILIQNNDRIEIVTIVGGG